MWKSCDDDCKRGYLLNTESGLYVAGTVTVIIFVVSIGLLTTLVEYKTYVFVSIIKIKTQWAVEPRDATK